MRNRRSSATQSANVVVLPNGVVQLPPDLISRFQETQAQTLQNMARFSPKMYAAMSGDFSDRKPTSAREAEHLLQSLGMSRRQAQAFVAGGWTKALEAGAESDESMTDAQSQSNLAASLEHLAAALKGNSNER